MLATIQIPQAFSVREENEFFAFQHLLARLNPGLHVSQVAIGLHVDGCHTVYWGLVHLAGQAISRAELEEALREAGFDFRRSKAKLDYSLVSQAAGGDGKPGA